MSALRERKDIWSGVVGSSGEVVVSVWQTKERELLSHHKDGEAEHPAAGAGSLGATSPPLRQCLLVLELPSRPCSTYCPAPLRPTVPGHVAQIPILLIPCAKHRKSSSTQTEVALTSKNLTHTNIQTFSYALHVLTLCTIHKSVPSCDGYEHGKASVSWSQASWILASHRNKSEIGRWYSCFGDWFLFREVTVGTDFA